MTPNIAYQVRSYADIDIFYNMPVNDLPVNYPQDYSKVDGLDNMPNICIESNGPANPRSFRDAITNEEYECQPMPFIEIDGENHPPNRIQ